MWGTGPNLSPTYEGNESKIKEVDMKKTLIILAMFLYVACAYSEQEREMMTPRGRVYVGMSKEELYQVYQKGDRIMVPQRLVDKEWIVYKDWMSNNPSDVITFYLQNGVVAGWKKAYDIVPVNKDSDYEYNQDERVDTWFFPSDKARWNGKDMTILDWPRLVRAQKVMFIKEYIDELNKARGSDVSVDIDKYILAMEHYSNNSPKSASAVLATEDLDKLLINDEKIEKEVADV
jgi:hypothetical protein